MELDEFIKLSLEEDTGSGDHTSLACIPVSASGKARLIIKDKGILAGMDLAKKVFHHIDPGMNFTPFLSDGDEVETGMVAFTIEGSEHHILRGERLVLNCMQRMSGIATTTRSYVNKLHGLKTRVLDTRKTTPLMRDLEKWAVRIGGGTNHRMGLYDMILIKDNHIDYAGGIINAIRNTNAYLVKNNLNIAVEIETRSLTEVRMVLSEGNVNRIMLDNFTPGLLRASHRIDFRKIRNRSIRRNNNSIQ
jgi:nicotinate-nucleotide pyrophosphorylase (carboxylating)